MPTSEGNPPHKLLFFGKPSPSPELCLPCIVSPPPRPALRDCRSAATALYITDKYLLAKYPPELVAMFLLPNVPIGAAVLLAAPWTSAAIVIVCLIAGIYFALYVVYLAFIVSRFPSDERAQAQGLIEQVRRSGRRQSVHRPCRATRWCHGSLGCCRIINVQGGWLLIEPLALQICILCLVSISCKECCLTAPSSCAQTFALAMLASFPSFASIFDSSARHEKAVIPFVITFVCTTIGTGLIFAAALKEWRRMKAAVTKPPVISSEDVTIVQLSEGNELEHDAMQQ